MDQPAYVALRDGPGRQRQGVGISARDAGPGPEHEEWVEAGFPQARRQGHRRDASVEDGRPRRAIADRGAALGPEARRRRQSPFPVRGITRTAFNSPWQGLTLSLVSPRPRAVE